MVYIGRGSPIAKLAIDVPGAVEVFEAFGLDYACSGAMSLEDAAHAEGVDPEAVIAQMRRLEAVEQLETWSDRSLADLVRYLTMQHHRFVRDVLTRISFRLAALDAPELVSLRIAVASLAEVLLPHLHTEETDVFPAIAALEDAWQRGHPRPLLENELRRQVWAMEDEHTNIGARLRTIRDLRTSLENADELPARCLEPLRTIRGLEAHLHEYMFLENSVLFPRALAMDEQIAVAAGLAPVFCR